MLAASSRFLAALRQAHNVVVTAKIYQPTKSPVSVPIEGGSVTLDRTAQLRRQATVDVPWSPTLSSKLTGVGLDLRALPFGSYVELKRGIRFGDGTSELVQLGYLRIDAVTWSTSQARATLSCSDRMAQVRDEPLTAPYNPATLKPSQAAQALVQAVFPSIAYSVTAGATETALVDAVFDRDRAAAVSSLAQAASCEAYFDELGGFVYRPVPTGTAADWTVDAGPTGVLVDAAESLDRTATYNGVLVKGQAASDQPPLSALVVDSDASSPTVWAGPFGKVVRIEESNAVQTVAQAQAAATALLDSGLGLARNLTLTAVPNPALVPGDRVLVIFPDKREELHVIDSLRIALDATGAVEAAARARYRPAVQLSAWDAQLQPRTFYDAAAFRELAGAET